jgi:hypothetical protein
MGKMNWRRSRDDELLRTREVERAEPEVSHPSSTAEPGSADRRRCRNCDAQVVDLSLHLHSERCTEMAVDRTYRGLVRERGIKGAMACPGCGAQTAMVGARAHLLGCELGLQVMRAAILGRRRTVSNRLVPIQLACVFDPTTVQVLAPGVRKKIRAERCRARAARAAPAKSAKIKKNKMR